MFSLVYSIGVILLVSGVVEIFTAINFGDTILPYEPATCLTSLLVGPILMFLFRNKPRKTDKLVKERKIGTIIK